MINEVCIIAYNLEHIKLNNNYVINGPGIDLYNFINLLIKNKIKVNLFTQVNPINIQNGVNYGNIYNSNKVMNSINNSDVVHHWSGIFPIYSEYLKYADSIDKITLVGPNVIDCVNLESEKIYLKNLNFGKIVTLNNRLRFKISKVHDVTLDKIDIFRVGPKLEDWQPAKERSDYILWKGNSKQFVKDIDFALRIKEKMSKYKFKFIGYPDTYEYRSHINEAKKAKLYISTSLSETKSNTLLEQWTCGCPSITHPKIETHGVNYETGIIVSRDLDSYCEAIEEVMENDNLYKRLSNGCIEYINKNFNYSKIYNDYLSIIYSI